MKTNMKNFAAQQLTKRQMNHVYGGAVVVACDVLDLNDKKIATVKGEGATFNEAWLDEANNASGYKVANCKS